MAQSHLLTHRLAGLTPASNRVSDAENSPVSEAEVADYIADMALLLHKLAVSATLVTVALQLELAYYAASAIAHPPVPSNLDEEK